MNVLRHNNEGMDLISAFAAVAVESLQEEAHMILDDE